MSPHGTAAALSAHDRSLAPAPGSVRTLGQLLDHWARVTPEGAALHFEGAETSYATYAADANRVAQALGAFGIRPNERIAFLGRSTDRFHRLFLGAAKAGAVLVPINWRLAPPEISYIINDCGCRILFVGPGFEAVVSQMLDQLPRLERVVALAPNPAGWPLLERWMAEHPPLDPGLALDATADVLQLYTSGTTGNPKGARLTHAGLLDVLSTQARQEVGVWSPRDSALVCAPLFHIGGVGQSILALACGGTAVIHAEFEPGRVLEAIETQRITKLFVVPAMILFMLQHPRCATTDFSSLDLVLYGAAPIPLELLRQAVLVMKADFIGLYGMTETHGAVTALLPEDHDPDNPRRMRSVGKPYGDVRIKVVDADGQELPPHEVGEILIHTMKNTPGYWNLPEASARTIRDGWLHSGDAGYFDEDGYLYIHDRVKDMIVSGGENVYPAEVESALYGHPAVADVAVIGVPDDRWGEAVKAVVVRKEGASVTAEELIAHARTRIAGYKAPKTVDFVEALPRNATGKILKRELRRPYWEGRDRQVN